MSTGATTQRAVYFALALGLWQIAHLRVALLGPAGSSHIVKWVNSLCERGLEVHLISAHQPSAEIDPRVKTHKIRLSPPFGYFSGRELRNILKTIEPDLLNAHVASGYGQLARLSRFHPVLLSVWGSDVYEFPNNGFIQRRLLISNLRNADAIASTSHAMKRQVLKYAAQKEIFVTPFGIDENKFSPKTAKADQPARPIVVGTVKTLESKYGVDVLIKAFASVYKSLSDQDKSWAKRLKLLIAGDGKQRSELEKLALDLGVGPVTEFRGYIPQAAVPACLNELDVFVALSRKESFGVAILEACACEVPVLVSDADGPAEVTVDNITGFVVPRDNVEAAAERLKGLILDADLRRRMGAAGRDNVLKNYTWKHSLDVMINTYRSVVGPSEPSAT